MWRVRSDRTGLAEPRLVRPRRRQSLRSAPVRHRRLASLLAAVTVAGLAATGCGQTSAAVEVDDESIAQPDFEDELEVVYENDDVPHRPVRAGRAGAAPRRGRPARQLHPGVRVRDGVRADPVHGGPGHPRGRGCRAHRRGCRRRRGRQSRARSIPRRSTACPKAMKDRYVEAFAAAATSCRPSSAPSSSAVLMDRVQDADVRISSRYGSWDAGRPAIDPPPGPRPAPGSDAAPARALPARSSPRGDAGRRPFPSRRRAVTAPDPPPAGARPLDGAAPGRGVRARARRPRPRHAGGARRDRARPAPLPAHDPPSVRAASWGRRTSFDDLYERGRAHRRRLRRHRRGAGGGGGRPRRGAVRRARARRSSPSTRSSCCVADDRVDVELLPALSFVDLAWVRLGVDPVERGRAAGRRPPVRHRRGGGAGPAARRPVRHGRAERRCRERQARRSATSSDAGSAARRRGAEPDRHRAAAPRPARRAHRRGAVARARPGGRARPPHVGLRPRPGRADRRRGGGVRRGRPPPAGRVPVGPRADPREPAPPPDRRGLRGARGHRPPRRRRRRGVRRPRGGAGRPAVPGRVPRHARRRGGAVHAGRRGPRHQPRS